MRPSDCSSATRSRIDSFIRFAALPVGAAKAPQHLTVGGGQMAGRQDAAIVWVLPRSRSPAMT